MSVEREMSLAEWCAKLPSQHVVNRELAELTKQLAALAEQNAKMREVLVLYSEATSEGYSGVFRACCASRPEEPHTHYCSCNKALSLPNLASPVLNRIKAEAYREVVDICEDKTTRWEGPMKTAANTLIAAIRAKADELE